MALVLYIPVAGAVDPRALSDALQPSPPAAPVARPEPAVLQAGWWHFFESEGEELERRIAEMKQRLQALPVELPVETAAAVRPLIERIETNLDALAQMRRQPDPQPPAPLAYAKRYTIPQLVDIIDRSHDAQIDLPLERKEVASAERAIDIAGQGVDTELAAYLALPLTDPERVLRGLEIMADRAAVAVAEEQLRVDKAKLLAHEVRVTQLTTELAVAASRLIAEKADLDRISAEIKQAEAILNRLHARVIEEQTTALSIAADKSQQTNLPRQQQRVVNAAVEEGIARLRVISLQAQYQLALLLSNAAVVDADALREQLAEWDTQLANLRKDVDGWKEESRQERDRAASGMASGSTLSEGAVPLFGMLYGDRLALAQRTLVALQRLDDTIAQIDVLVQIVNEELVRHEGALSDWLARGELVLQHLWEMGVGWARESLFKIGDTPVTTLGLLRVALILFVAWLISYWFRRVLARLGEKHETITQSALYTVGRLSHYGFITLGFVIGLSSIGVDFTTFALVAGAIGIGIGFGLQSIVSNFVSGLILLFERTLKVGDFVELRSGVSGEVRAINVRSTLISTNDNVEIVVPNSQFINDDVINWTLLEAFCRIHVSFKVPYGTDVDVVTEAGLEAADRVPHTLKQRKPSVWLVDFGDSSFDFELVVWITPEAVKRPAAVNAAYKREIAAALRRHGIEIPVPQRELRWRPDSENSSFR